MDENILKNSTSDKLSIRKALTDVSNIQRPLSKKNNGITKPLKDKHESYVHSRQIPRSIKTSIALSRKSMVKLKTNVPEAKNNKTSIVSNKSTTKSYYTNYGSNYRVPVKNHAVKMRNSLPYSKITGLLRDDVLKKNNHDEGKVREKANQRMEPRPNQIKGRLLSRKSNGFLIKGSSKGKVEEIFNNVPRGSIKPIVKKPVALSGTWKSSYAANMKKHSLVEKPLKGKDGRKTNSLVPSDKLRLLVTSDKSCLTTTASNANVGGKSDRRKSFTSLILRGPKIEKQVTFKKEDELIGIDDSQNHLDVADYVDDIYQYYWVTEAHCPCLTGYMNIHTDISSKMRAILVNWLIEVHFKFNMMPETLYLTITLLDKYLSMVCICKNELQLVGLTALLLASKYEEFWHPRIEELISISAESYTRDQFLGMEKLILKKLKFRFNLPTPYVFMLRFLKAAESDKKLEHLSFYLIELCLHEYDALKFKPSVLSASAIYVARSMLQIAPQWTPLLNKHARYDESQLRDCVVFIRRIHGASGKGNMDVTYKKYLSPQLGCVAAILKRSG